MIKYLLLSLVCCHLALGQNIFATDIIGAVSTYGFPCASMPTAQNFGATSCLSTEHACEVAEIFAETQLNRICSGFSCAAVAQNTTAGEPIELVPSTAGGRCRYAASRTTCRRTGSPPAPNPQCASAIAFYCSVTCEGGCECAAAAQTSTSQSTASGSQVLFGRTHAPTGTASLSASGDGLLVNNNGNLGSGYGVAIDMGQSQSSPTFGVQVTPVSLESLNNNNFQTQNLNNLTGPLEGPQAFLQFVPIVGVANSSPESLWVATFQAPIAGESIWNFTLLPQTTDFQGLIITASNDGDSVANLNITNFRQAQAYVPMGRWFVNPYSTNSGQNPQATLSFDSAVDLTLMPTSGNPSQITADTLTFQPYGLSAQPGALNQMLITGQNTASFLIFSEQ